MIKDKHGHKFKNYGEYLKKSIWWEQIRSEAIMRNYKTCELCWHTNTRFEVHHKNYENVGHENLSDLIVLCSQCHRHLHFAEEEKIDTSFLYADIMCGYNPNEGCDECKYKNKCNLTGDDEC